MVKLCPNVLFDFSRRGAVIVLGVNGQFSLWKCMKPGNMTGRDLSWRFFGEKWVWCCHSSLPFCGFSWLEATLLVNRETTGYTSELGGGERRVEENNRILEFDGKQYSFTSTFHRAGNLRAPLRWPWPLTLWLTGYLLRKPLLPLVGPASLWKKSSFCGDIFLF